jgi:hypothetical protein
MIALDSGLDDAWTLCIGACWHGKQRMTGVLTNDSERRGRHRPGSCRRRTMPGYRLTNDGAELLIVHWFWCG